MLYRGFEITISLAGDTTYTFTVTQFWKIIDSQRGFATKQEAKNAAILAIDAHMLGHQK